MDSGQVERLPGFHEDTSIQDRRVEGRSLPSVRGERVAVRPYLSVDEQDREDGSHLQHLDGRRMIGQNSSNAARDRATRLEEVFEGARLLELVQGGHPRGHRRRVSRERAAVEELVPRRVRELEDLRPAQEGAARQAPSDHLAEAHEIRDDSICMLGASVRHAKAAHDLVENQRDVEPRGHLSESLEEVPIGGDERALDRLQDDASEAIRMLADASLGGREVVERKDEGVLQDMVGRSPGARGGREASVRLLPRGRVTDEELVDPSVVMPLEFSDHRSASIGAGDAHRVEGRLGPGDGEANHPVRVRAPARLASTFAMRSSPSIAPRNTLRRHGPRFQVGGRGPEIVPIVQGPAKTRRFFDRIAPWYDWINARIYKREWLNRVRSEIRGTRALDVGVGTGLSAGGLPTAIGIDLSRGTLSGGRCRGGLRRAC